eukprot:1161793-Pelagomonas_calceolata.AAC.4
MRAACTGTCALPKVCGDKHKVKCLHAFLHAITHRSQGWAGRIQLGQGQRGPGCQLLHRALSQGTERALAKRQRCVSARAGRDVRKNALHPSACIHAHTNKHTNTNTHAHTDMHMRMRTHTHTQTHTGKHVCTHAQCVSQSSVVLYCVALMSLLPVFHLRPHN